MRNFHQPYKNDPKRRKERCVLTFVDPKTPEKVLHKYHNRSVILEECDTLSSIKELISPTSEPNSAKPFTNIYDPLIQTTPLSKPESLFRRKLQHNKNDIENKNKIQEITKDVAKDECHGECFAKVVNKTTETLLLKFQEVLQTEKMIMLELVNKSSGKDDLLLKFVNKAEELNRENAILQLENKGLKGMLNSWNK